MILIGIAIGAALVGCCCGRRLALRMRAATGNPEGGGSPAKENVSYRNCSKLRGGPGPEHTVARGHNSQLNAELGRAARVPGARESFKQQRTNYPDGSPELSQKALNANNQSFLELANATLQKFQQTAKGDGKDNRPNRPAR